MGNLEGRIERLEKHTGAGKPERKTWALVDGEPEPAGIAEKDLVIRVVDGEARELTLRVLAGERTEREGVNHNEY